MIITPMLFSGPGAMRVQVGAVNILAGATATITLATGYTASTSYAIGVSTDDAANHGNVTPFAQTATSFKITNPDGGAAHNFMWLAIGN